MNLEKQIKRHVIGPRHTCFALTLPGFEPACQGELAELSPTLGVEKVVKGGIVFSGRLTDLYRANLHLRTAGRVLLRLATFKATNFRQLAKKSQTLAWAHYLPKGAIPDCKVTVHHSRLYHSKAVAQHLGQSIAAYWQERQVAPGDAKGQTLFVRLENDRISLSLDSSGDNLYRRGLKRHGAQAPLRETTAAAILLHAGYRPDMALVDPMCGAGTFSLEAALMVKAIAPGLQREFAFMQWPAFKPRQWQHLKKVSAEKIQTPPKPTIFASDLENRACLNLNQCIESNRLKDTVQVRQHDFFSLNPGQLDVKAGLVVINPPYGRRLAPSGNLKDFYRRLADKLQGDFAGWRVALIAPKNLLNKKLTTSLTNQPLVHGGLTLTLVTGKLGQ